MDALITRIFPQTFDGTFIDDKVTKLGMYALYYQSEIKQIRLPMVKELSNYALAHSGVTSLNDESLPICTVVSNYAFQYCQSLKSVALSAVTYVCQRWADISTLYGSLFRILIFPVDHHSRF